VTATISWNRATLRHLLTAAPPAQPFAGVVIDHRVDLLRCQKVLLRILTDSIGQHRPFRTFSAEAGWKACGGGLRLWEDRQSLPNQQGYGLFETGVSAGLLDI
jgi:hypothetical protein